MYRGGERVGDAGAAHALGGEEGAGAKGDRAFGQQIMKFLVQIPGLIRRTHRRSLSCHQAPAFGHGSGGTA